MGSPTRSRGTNTRRYERSVSVCLSDMSRDFEIRSNDTYSSHLDRHTVVDFLASLPNVTVLSQRYAEFEVEDLDLWMPIHLAFRDSEGNLYDDMDVPPPEYRESVNAICFNISAGGRKGDTRDKKYMDVVFSIAGHFDWQVYDCDMGTYLDPSHPDMWASFI
jgi:hypothetical protein